MSELLPCPFCGGEAELTGFDAPEYWVWCPNCKASTDAHTGKQSAIEAWNTRADDYKQAAEYWQRMYEESFTERMCDITELFDSSGGVVATYCGCGCLLEREDNYCPNCGARVTPKNSESTPKAMDEPVEVWNQWSTDDVTCWEVDA